MSGILEGLPDRLYQEVLLRKRLRFFYRYISSSRRLRQLFTVQGMIVVIVAIFVLGVLSMYTPMEQARSHQTVAAQQTLTPDPAAGPTRTPLPEEFLTNSQMTVGITLGAAILVLIVVFGVITYLPKTGE